TPHAYLDPRLEDVSIVLDNALWEGRFWLPYRQELEIRRRATWLDMPARGIIRARWEIDGYVFNVGLAPSWFQGDEITFLPKAERDSFPWREPTSYDEVRDVGDEPVIAPLLNSFSSQEFGADYGDYYRADGARLTYRHGSGVRGEWSAALGRETIHSLAVTAQPASGRFRPNPALGGVGLTLAQLAVRRRSEGFAVRRDVHYELIAEAGHADDGTNYLRLSGSGHVLLPAGATRLLVRAQGGAATRDLPAHRSFVLGGRGTLLGDAFRSWGGGRMALAHVEWRVALPFVSLGVGPYARTPRQLTIAPYVAAGWADRAVPGTPWAATPGTRVTFGAGLEWLGVFRFE